ncbi:ATP synthase mitochondrial F1 complex assembly factor 2-like [Mizuhopecten yessoensis]|uniref:ATP synthase mitochondrial F1 complex assembly factor 2 n=1 Tax=Mizuhopecten yessoensis TaxID=6573 RepID=A0A210QM85_MIZYE|nr:ATP synthase mitochondrial F1 complex assembly factor 2-like [Mizuhopecten yessoensis]OWF49801.1 ATP synthase mitochondrial F1 complex assembly factor 2 [Mizuhopecten yessoensis]
MAAPMRLFGRWLLAEGKPCISRIIRERKTEGLTFSQIRQTASPSRELKKFYKNAYVVQSNGWFEINLDNRKLRTPTGNLFRVPSETLAMAVATEWNAQQDTIKRHNMHLNSLSNTALDNPIGKTKEEMTTSLMHFLETDTICFRLTEPQDLAELQQKEWEPIMKWASDRYKVELCSTTGLQSLVIPANTRQTLEKYLIYNNEWALHGYQFGVEALKSLLLMLAVVHKQISVERAVYLSRLESQYQADTWGNVEWHHDFDKYDLQARVAAAAVFIHWCSEKTSVWSKR